MDLTTFHVDAPQGLRFSPFPYYAYLKHCTLREVTKMWKYTSTCDCNEFLLSLNLFDCNDTKKYINTLYAISNNIEKNYRIYKIKKRNGKYRTIYEPKPLLKHIQKQILANILNDRSISKYATAYHKGLSIKANALPHVKKDVILKLDIKDFFESISFMNVYNSCFQVEYFLQQFSF